MGALALTACSGDEEASETTTSSPPSTARPTSVVSANSTTTTTEPEPALVLESAGDDDGAVYSLDWSNLQYPALFVYDDETNPDDPFFHLHDQPEEGFFLSLEMYTTGFGEAWKGETGTFEVSCTPEGSGICIHFDPDADGEEFGDLGADFAATGTVEITQLDDEGYDLTLTDVAFADGTTIPGPTHLEGEATEPAPTDDSTTTTTTD